MHGIGDVTLFEAAKPLLARNNALLVLIVLTLMFSFVMLHI